MKFLVLVCEGMADEPVEELELKTPLELARTPGMDELAARGRIGSARFISRSLAASKDVACMEALGFDAPEFYTGPAPLCGLGSDIVFDDRPVVFRCDLVTVAQGKLVDATAGRIGSSEAEALLGALSEKLGNARFKFVPGDGYKNILLVSDPELSEAFDDIETRDPALCVDQPAVKGMPRGRASAPIVELAEQARQVLEEHEVNRVRIDLGENPANFAWFWGQGKKPKMPAFDQLFGVSLAVVSEKDFVRGLGAAVRGRVYRRLSDLERACHEADLVFVYVDAGLGGAGESLKTKIKRIEEFDADTVRKTLRFLDSLRDEWRLCVASDVVESHKKRSVLRDSVPLVIAGAGIEPGGVKVFSEKNCAQSGLVFDPGHSWVTSFLKGAIVR